MPAKAEIITFKVTDDLMQALARVPNRSEFIRRALAAALDNVCPVCQGTGRLSPKQAEHWDQFAAEHELTECNHCHELRLVCRRPGSKKPKAKAK